MVKPENARKLDTCHLRDTEKVLGGETFD
jgi:hypothetical protein